MVKMSRRVKNETFFSPTDYSNLLEVALSHSEHEDQQIRGLVRTIAGNLIASYLMQDNYLLVENENRLLSKNVLVELVTCLLQVCVLNVI